MGLRPSRLTITTLAVALLLPAISSAALQEGQTAVTFSDAQLPGGVRLRYAARGAAGGPVVVMLHGYSDSWFSFSRVIPLLPKTIRVIALDQRGHGDSGRPARGYAMDDFARDIIQLMDTLKIERATVVGHSMGSFVARRLAALAPERVTGLMLVGAGIRANNEAIQSLGNMVDKLTDPVDPAFVREFQLSTIARPVPPEFIERAISESHKLTADVWRQVFTGMIEYKPAEPAIKCPTVVIGGDKDAIFSVAEQQALARAIDGASIALVPGVGHALHWEDPERFASELVAFIGRLPRP